MEKKNKNKKRLGVLALLLLLILAIGATAGTTLAKYITKGEVETQRATVAKWGYTIGTDANKLFGEQYNKGDILATKVTTPTYAEVDVVASSTKSVVAPGTKGETTITIAGTSEVNAILEIKLTDFQNIVLKIKEGTDYYPIKWYVNDTLVTFGEDAEKSLADAIVAVLNNTTKPLVSGVTAEATKGTDAKYAITAKIPANSTIAEDFKIKISWKWDFDTEAKDGANDANDTILGQIANGKNPDAEKYADSVIEVQLGYKVTVTQDQNK